MQKTWVWTIPLVHANSARTDVPPISIRIIEAGRRDVRPRGSFARVRSGQLVQKSLLPHPRPRSARRSSSGELCAGRREHAWRVYLAAQPHVEAELCGAREREELELLRVVAGVVRLEGDEHLRRAAASHKVCQHTNTVGKCLRVRSG